MTQNSVELRVSDTPVPYPESVATMEGRVASVRAGTAPELIWLLEHPPLYTAGTTAQDTDLLSPQRFPVYKTGRGGQYTYHGPGQRIAYVILDLKKRNEDVRCFVRDLESWAIAALTRFGVTGKIRSGRVGIWVTREDGREDKIGAIGVRVRRWVSYHGLALNVCPNLDHFSGIVPCGISDSDKGVTSLSDLGIAASMGDMDTALAKTFSEVFGRPLEYKVGPL
ncbi:MAG: lipoate-protein ligase B [Candidatus Marinimicrobia bacterium]|nr:lipoate-protein ligase B [Candidatus Neomarinimicrobiota bacterium]